MRMSKRSVPLHLAGLVTVLPLGILLFHCGKTVDGAGADGGSTRGDSTTAPVPSDTDSGTSDNVDAGFDGARVFDAAPPEVSCAADASACDELPSSVCADETTVLYFNDGTCVDGGCQWKEKTMACFQGMCVQGGCTPPTTK
jgi:hypothetical protein